MSVGQRLWTYQAERFPLIRTVPLLAVFAAASINVSAVFAGRELPGIGAYAVGLLLALIIFFQMRATDEFKDHDDDTRYRPERPIPRGLVSLRLILGIGLALVPVAALVAWLWAAGVFWLLLLVWAWLALMTAEFGVAKWLKARPLIYLVSHMAIMPLIDLMLTGIEWVPAGGPAPALWLFLVLSIINGCVLEIGRKVWALESEREGVDSYSGLWGAERSAMIWLCVVALALFFLIAIGLAAGAPLVVALVGLAGCAGCAWVASSFRRNPTAEWQSRVDNAAGLWVLLCYGVIACLPLFTGVG
ncbi:UbiA family prenyltransferase [Aliiroseovarius sp. YM-037]|uniref:UbiA family prenyltransferase n=1 Tax=Aliiroseovarius sp. YM-037 TaxID=3341728 RepID=UPI003A800B07